MANDCSLASARAASQRARRRRRNVSLLAVVCLAGGAALHLAWREGAGAQEAKQAAGAHGALATAEQRKLLQKLEPHPADGPAPRGVDARIWQSLIPEDNALNEARVALGRDLYFEERLSRDGTVACATCHDVSRGFADQRPASEGIGGQVGRRNAPTTLNAMLLHTQFWDGRAPTLEEQAKLPITNPIEMGMPNEAAAVAAIAQFPGYAEAFQDAYGRAVNFDDIARALAAFERTLVFLDAPFDRFTAGDVDAISSDAKQGWALFLGKARCVSCHQLNSSNPLGTNNKFHNIGVAARHKDFESLALKALKVLQESGNSTEVQDRLALETDFSELGRFVVTTDRTDIGAFRTSQLRNVGITAPYMHDGSLGTLWDVMDHYNKGGEANPYLDGGIEPLALSEAEIDQLVAFMFSLTDTRFAALNEDELQRQRSLKEERRPFRDDALQKREVLQFEGRLTGNK